MIRHGSLPYIGTCPGMRYATACIALGDTPIWERRQKPALHTHPVYMLEYVKVGTMHFCLDGGEPIALGPGMYYVAAPGVSHSHGVDGEFSNIHVALRPEFVRQAVAEALPGAGSGLPHFPTIARKASPALGAVLRAAAGSKAHRSLAALSGEYAGGRTGGADSGRPRSGDGG